MKILIGGASSKIFHLKEFGEMLKKQGHEYLLVHDIEVYSGFPSRNISKWFETKAKLKNIIKKFKPDIIFVDRQTKFGLAAIETKIPVFIHLRGDYWSEIQWAKETLYKYPLKRIILNMKDKTAKKCFSNSEIIIPICKYLEKIVQEQYPNKKTQVMYQGIDPTRWYKEKGMTLKHPCVGLLQGAVIWGKAREMLILEKVLKSMPETTFYWAGDGPYREKILSVLNKYENFHWLGPLEYPNKVRQYLSEIDVYALVSGIDMSPLTLQEAQLMKKPVVATNVGGIPELMENNETGFLIGKGDTDQWIEKLTALLKNEEKRIEMGNSGRRFIENNFSWEKVVSEFLKGIRNLE
jgi:glycosyltransferase involved in cell wall biosynthesis